MLRRRALALFFASYAAISLGETTARADTMSFAKGPYLQELSAHSVQIRWEGSVALPGVVTVHGPGEKTLTKIGEGENLFHTVRIDDLLPATTYSYVVSVGDIVSTEGHFTTAPDDDRAFSFLAYGDNRSDPSAHGAIVKALLGAPGEMLVHTGDMVLSGGDDADWRSFFEIETPLLRDRCVFATVGNHELISGGAPMFLKYFHAGQVEEKTTLHATMRWGSARFFFLNAMAPWSSGDEEGWLEAELTKSDTEPGIAHRFVVTHYGPFSSGPHGGNEPMKLAGGLASMKAHHVDLLFAGHDHIYERGEVEGFHYLITGGGGAPLYKPRAKPNDATEVVESAHHYVEVRVDGPLITTVAKRPDGTTMDTCSLRRNEPWSCETSLPPAHLPPGSSPPGDSGKKSNCGCEMGSFRDRAASFEVISAAIFAAAFLRRRDRWRASARFFEHGDRSLL